MPGVRGYGFHEGSRSEYLAQFVFASWGTAVVIPQQEDHGLDLHCTLMDRVGGRLLAKAPYTVQVKSEMKPVVFKGKEAVRWVIEHPLPLFLCVVDKASARLSIYHTLARFYAWSMGQRPETLAMIPQPAEPGRLGRCCQWPGTYDLSLDQPILDFTFTQMMDEAFWRKAQEIFEFWVNVDNDNLTRVRTRLLMCRMPDDYETNSTRVRAWMSTWLQFPNDEQFSQTTANMRESLEWVGGQLLRQGDVAGAGKAALLHRHLFPDGGIGGSLHQVQLSLNACVGRQDYVYAGVDYLAEVVRGALEQKPADGSAASGPHAGAGR